MKLTEGKKNKKKEEEEEEAVFPLFLINSRQWAESMNKSLTEQWWSSPAQIPLCLTE